MTVVVVNYKVADCVVSCLHSLVDEVATNQGCRVVVVDNDSQDQSYEIIAKAIQDNGWQEWAEVVRSDYNGGYAYGNNFAIRLTEQTNRPTAFYWLLNPDSTAKPGALSRLIDFMSSHPQVGICGSSIEMEDGTLWPYCFRFPTVFSEFERGLQLGLVTRLLDRWQIARKMSDADTQVDWLPGASTLIRRQTLQEVGLLDEGYFLYYEETDFCLNALRLGWQCWYVPSSRIMHIGGVSTGVTASDSIDTEVHQRVPQYIFDSRYRYFYKNFGMWKCLCADAAWIFSYSLRRLRKLVERRSSDEPQYLWRDSLKNSLPMRWLLSAQQRKPTQ